MVLTEEAWKRQEANRAKASEYILQMLDRAMKRDGMDAWFFQGWDSERLERLGNFMCALQFAPFEELRAAEEEWEEKAWARQLATEEDRATS